MAELEKLVVRIEGDVKDLNKKLSAVDKKLGQTEKQSARLGSALKSAIVPVAVTAGLAQFTRSVIDAGVRMEALESRMLAATSSAALAKDAFSFIAQESDRLGLSFEDSANGFALFSAAALRAGLTMQQTKDIFSATSEAATVLKLSAADTRLTLNALSQIAAKGVVSMEEMRQQLGERLPFAMAAMADGLNITQRELIDLISTGELAAREALPALAEGLRNVTGDSVVVAAESLQASFNRLNNELLLLRTSIAESGFNQWLKEGVELATFLTEGVRRLVSMDAEVGSLAHQFGILSKEEREAARHAEELRATHERIMQQGVSFGDVGLGSFQEEFQSGLPDASALGIDFDKLDKELEGLQGYFMSREELEIEHLTRRMETLQEFAEMESQLDADQKQKLLDAAKIHADAIVAVEDKMAKDKARSEDRYNKQVSRMRDANFNDAIGMLKSLFSENKAASLALIALEKARGIAQVFINTEIAAARALAELGPIAGAPVAASIKTQGAISMGLIAAQGLLEGAAAAGGGGSSPSVIGSAAEQASDIDTLGGGDGGGTSRNVTINLGGRAFISREEVETIVNGILEYENDGGTVRVLN